MSKLNVGQKLFRYVKSMFYKKIYSPKPGDVLIWKDERKLTENSFHCVRAFK